MLARTLGGEWRTAAASDPLGRPVTARWLLAARRDGGGRVGARRSGSGCSRRRSATRSSPRAAGLGELLVAVLAAGPAAVLVCVGGTATVDGGAACVATLPRWPGAVPLRVLCDVRNPLLGARGAARVFGPQKGAGPEAVDGARAAARRDRRARAVPRPAGRGRRRRARRRARVRSAASCCEGAEVVLDS